jgi:hypothetical protein
LREAQACSTIVVEMGGLMDFRTIMRGAALGAALAGASAGVAMAQNYTPEQQSACQGDAFQFCAGDIPNIPAIEACLKANINQLSPACRAEFEPQGKSRLRREHFPQ